ncbi:mannitol dehydrogenase family protein [Sphingomonas sp. S1-29]|uniref:mannitol dehydrogenase family protein n=1 Tax=Sphingomonas sp. S1-29 TaxID=2991074 RepID=UPI00223F27AE|nr:mannitol dehydrogenase family protein [Sphingomonas sp. S1-29]UZK68266.1 mannitol dehydrogenase family protein [Sphingomonas sp. S1-29]
MTRLSRATLDHLPTNVGRPGNTGADVQIGIVHFGPGAFHRAHQAAYFDSLLATDPRWGIAAVSLRTPELVEALAAQDGLYSLTILDSAVETRVIGAHRAWVGPGEGARVHALLADPAVRLVTSTVTEKGYCLRSDGTLDTAHRDIVHDAANPDDPHSLIGWIVAGLAARRAAGTEPFAVLCCDNMTGNGRKLRAAVIALAEMRDPALAAWIGETVVFPDSMVDSITPATDDAHLARAAGALGVADLAAVQREAFTQWVLEDVALPGDPDLASVGVIRTGDVAAYERAKLRILNGAHSTLAYVGLARGHASVGEAMADAPLAAFVEAMVREDIVPSLGAIAGFDVQAYAGAVLDRFRNPEIRHLLSQIAGDGSQKLPYRILDTVTEARAAGRPIARLAVPIAAWIAFLRDRAERGEAIADPLADQLAAAVMAQPEGDAIVGEMLAIDAIFPVSLANDADFRAAVAKAYRDVTAGGLG